MILWVVEIYQERRWRPIGNAFPSRKECVYAFTMAQQSSEKGFWNAYKTRIACYKRVEE